MPARILGLYSLACMDREGSAYGYRISRQIAERTDGAWTPGPGAVYPALRALVDRGLATAARRQRRLEYRITARGRGVLRRIRNRPGRPASAPDLSVLWAEIVGVQNTGELMLRRMRHATGAVAEYLDRGSTPDEVARAVRARALAELAAAQRRLRGRSAVRLPARAARRR
ncbi:MAG TPA: PadR family transcriptional regulator [Thermoplasmata archaeon]|nr:PadR family transcriptional regulator [Thermoplasmata archaeon]